MRNRVLTVLLLLAGILGLAFFSAQAQIGDEDRCRSGCRDAQAECTSACGAHSNPMECEDECEQQAQECKASCP
jgi:hypothetical protein